MFRIFSRYKIMHAKIFNFHMCSKQSILEMNNVWFIVLDITDFL